MFAFFICEDTTRQTLFGQKLVTNNDDDDRIIVSSYKLVRNTNHKLSSIALR